MTIALAVLSILVVTFLANLFNAMRIVRPICPICAGVALTWIWLILAYFTGYNFDPMVIAMLMGGSVVGLAYAADSSQACFLNPCSSPPDLLRPIRLFQKTGRSLF